MFYKTHIAILYEALDEFSFEPTSHAWSRYITSLRDGNDGVDLLNLLLSQYLPDLFSQAVSHVFPAFVHRDAVDYRVRSSEIAEFEDIWTVRLSFHNLVGHRIGPFPEDNGLSLSSMWSQRCLVSREQQFQAGTQNVDWGIVAGHLPEEYPQNF